MALSKLAEKISYHLFQDAGKEPSRAKPEDFVRAAILALQEDVKARMMGEMAETYKAKQKRVYYLSAEFLIGRLLRDTLYNLGLLDEMKAALKELGGDFDLAMVMEPDAALGNGGLGRLAACFMESLSTLDIPAHGYGIRYRHGLFKQGIKDGQQTEAPELWLENGNPWEVTRGRRTFTINFGGSVANGKWQPAEQLIAAAHDTPIAGWKGKRINKLRLWQARPSEALNLDAFNAGDLMGAQADGAKAEAINRVLYPSDSNPAGHQLRLRQQFFFVSASLQDILRRHHLQFGTFENLSEHIAIQLNDTHPSIAIAELMRLLVDENGLTWDAAWKQTKASCAYTNHTLLPEALETWPVGLMEYLLPRHMQIIYQINDGLMKEAAAFRPNDNGYLAAVSLINEQGSRSVRMGQLAFAGTHSVNGVSALHSNLMKQTVFKELHALYPSRINNKTNGVTPRRWFHEVNPHLSALVASAIGPDFIDDHAKIIALKPFASDRAMQDKFNAIKLANKQKLAAVIKERCNVIVDPSALFDVQIKRIHEYKRQQLAILETVALYQAIKANPNGDWVPRVKLFAGKAAPSYWAAKNIIRLINDVGNIVNNDASVKGLLKVVFLPNYNVSLAESIIPAANLSEQISTAGLEASGTGNMKLAMNGALTIGTMDGANVEMSEQIGVENMFIFGLSAAEVAQRHASGHNPTDIINKTPQLKGALDAIASGMFSGTEPGRYQVFVDNLYRTDYFMVTSDFVAYADALCATDKLWKNQNDWAEKAIINVASMGWFSSDRTIGEYAKEIWKV